MAKKKENIVLTEKDMREIEEQYRRRKAKEQGMFDGRFVTKPMQNKKYDRKEKHKKNTRDLV